MSGPQASSGFYDNSSWEWYCGDGDEWKSDDKNSIGPYSLSGVSKDLNNCSINIVAAFLHLIFVGIFLVTLIFKGCFGGFRTKSRYLFRWPGHILRWILIIILLVLAIVSIVEGIMSDMTLHGSKLTPRLYLPAVLFFITNLSTLLYYHLAEFWRKPRMCWTLFIYWSFCLTIDGVKLIVFYQESVPIDTVRLWTTISTTIVHIFLCMVELNLIIFNAGLCVGGVHSGVRDSSNPIDDQFNDDMKFTEDYVSFIYYITFWWVNWLLKLGFRRPLEIQDLGTLPKVHRSQYLYAKFKKDFEKELKQKTSIGKKPSVWKVFGRVFKKDIFCAGLVRLAYDITSFVGPLSLSGIVSYVVTYSEHGENSQKQPHQYVTIGEFFSNGFVLVVVICLANVLQYVMWQQNLYLSNVVGVHVRTAIQTMVYDKSLRLSSYAISGGSMTVGKIANLMSTDAYNLFFFSQRMHHLWAVPFRVISVIMLMYIEIGPPAFFGLAALLVAISTQLIIARLQTRKQKNIMKSADDRLRRSNEMLLGIKLLKLYGWEEMICKAIERVRNLEMASVLKYNGCYGITFFMVQITPTLMTLWVFVSYPYLTGQPLEPSTTFVTLSLMSLLVEPMYFVPMVTSLLVNVFVGVSRLQSFFLATESESVQDLSEDSVLESSLLETSTTFTNDMPVAENERVPLLRDNSVDNYQTVSAQKEKDHALTHQTAKEHNPYAIKITNGCFTWSDDNLLPVIKDVNLEISHGELVMIVGAVGSGKSSLLSAILGEMKTLYGSVDIGSQSFSDTKQPSSGIAYCAQTSWLMNASLRDNILFGNPYNRARYRKVIEASGLKQDIEILPGGDMTEIGEKGINLSGGQKQRVSVARAMYCNNSIVLLDDPLSALDVNVGGHLFHRGIIRRLHRYKRTVLLVTHQLQYLQHADKIIVMKDGRIDLQGTFDDVVRENSDLYMSWQHDLIIASEHEASSGMSGTESEDWEALKKEVSRIKYGGAVKTTLPTEEILEKHVKGQLIQQEELARGSVSLNAYLYYIKNMGVFLAIAFAFSRIALEAFIVSRNFWLADWAEAGLNDSLTIYDTNSDYIPGFTGLCFGSVVVAACSCAASVIATWTAAKRMHIRMLRNISRSPLRFFDTTPIGRVLNRFSSDTQIIDMKLLITTSSLLHFFSSFMVSLVANAIITPIFLLEVLPIIVIYYLLGIYFIRSSRELQRLDSITRSPVFAHFSEALGGLTTIRAYREQTRFFDSLLWKIDTNNTPLLYLQVVCGWLGLQMSICGGIMVLMVGLTTLLQATVFGSLEASLVGLGLTYVLMVSQQLFNLIRFLADTEMQMNPVERVQYYATLPTENYHGFEPPSDWPRRGGVEIRRLSVRYVETLPPVLRNVSLSVRPGEKVGICGRTGSGKSTLTLAFFRMIQTFKGTISIDGLNIANLSITTLRQRLSIIPQDPVMFTGTIRSNLDPNGVKSNRDLWHALEIAQLKHIVAESTLGLDMIVSEGGENFSVGQRQLFCLARAFLRNSRVLIMDEATASIDYDTERILQRVVYSIFHDKTVLTVAHRVATILGCDTIWVLDKGKIIECDSPENLLARPTSVFAAMVDANK